MENVLATMEKEFDSYHYHDKFKVLVVSSIYQKYVPKVDEFFESAILTLDLKDETNIICHYTEYLDVIFSRQFLKNPN